MFEPAIQKGSESNQVRSERRQGAGKGGLDFVVIARSFGTVGAGSSEVERSCWLFGGLVGRLVGWLVHGWREVCNKAKISGLWSCGFWLQSDGRVADYRCIIG
jgi:hypothetical protein